MSIRPAHGLSLNINERFHVVRWVDEGQEVIAPVVNDGKETGLRCVVTVAAGLHARVECASRGFAQWYAIEDLRMEVATP